MRPEPLLKVAAAAQILNVTPHAVYNYVAKGMPHIRLSPKCIRFREDDIRAWVETCRFTKTNADVGKSLSCKEGDAFTAFARRTRPRPKPQNGKPNSGAKSSGLTNLVEFPNTASNKR